MASRIQGLMQLLGSMSKADKKKFLKKMHEHREYDKVSGPDTRTIGFSGQSDYERVEELMELLQRRPMSRSEYENPSQTSKLDRSKLLQLLIGNR